MSEVRDQAEWAADLNSGCRLYRRAGRFDLPAHPRCKWAWWRSFRMCFPPLCQPKLTQTCASALTAFANLPSPTIRGRPLLAGSSQKNRRDSLLRDKLLTLECPCASSRSGRLLWIPHLNASRLGVRLRPFCGSRSIHLRGEWRPLLVEHPLDS